MPEFGLKPMYRIMKKAGADRVSDESAYELRETVEVFAARVARRAVECCKHAGRVTMKEKDIRMAVSTLMRDGPI